MIEIPIATFWILVSGVIISSVGWIIWGVLTLEKYGEYEKKD